MSTRDPTCAISELLLAPVWLATLRDANISDLKLIWDWIAFGAALLLLPCGVFEACGDAPQNRGEALTLACVPSAPCGNQKVVRTFVASMA